MRTRGSERRCTLLPVNFAFADILRCFSSRPFPTQGISPRHISGVSRRSTSTFRDETGSKEVLSMHFIRRRCPRQVIQRYYKVSVSPGELQQFIEYEACSISVRFIPFRKCCYCADGLRIYVFTGSWHQITGRRKFISRTWPEKQFSGGATAFES